MKININDIRKYYGPVALQENIESALITIGKPVDEITIDDLAVVDEFHVRGQAATNELIEAAGLLPGSKILDMGCGLGGSARRLASRLNCQVTGVDLSEEYVTCAKYL
ncbi:MAG: methyltransferase domain-containing protein, partial [Pseudomonadota bacterium]